MGHEDTAEAEVEQDISTEKKFEVGISKGGERVDEELTNVPVEGDVFGDGDDLVEEDENLALLSEAKQANTTLKESRLERDSALEQDASVEQDALPEDMKNEISSFKVPLQ